VDETLANMSNSHVFITFKLKSSTNIPGEYPNFLSTDSHI